MLQYSSSRGECRYLCDNLTRGNHGLVCDRYPHFRFTQSYHKKMSDLQYFAYEGVGQNNLKQHGYSQAVRVGDRIECAGQGEEFLKYFVGAGLPTLILFQVDGIPRRACSTRRSTNKLTRHSQT